MSSLAKIAQKVHDKTGATGAELECRVFFLAMMTAAVVGDTKAADHFEKRMRNSYRAWRGGKQ